MDSVMRNPEVAGKLIEIVRMSRECSRDAYEAICPSESRNLVDFLGSSFAAKFLYFAGGGEMDHPCIILDEIVAAALDTQGMKLSRSSGKWTAEAYSSYCELLEGWAQQRASELDRAVGADEYERLLISLT